MYSAVQLLVKFNMADLKGHTKKSGDMIRDRVRILYLLFLWLCCTKFSILSTILFSIVSHDCGLDSSQTTCSVLLTKLYNMWRTTLFNPVFNNLQQLIIFTRVPQEHLHPVGIDASFFHFIRSCKDTSCSHFMLIRFFNIRLPLKANFH